MTDNMFEALLIAQEGANTKTAPSGIPLVTWYNAQKNMGRVYPDDIRGRGGWGIKYVIAPDFPIGDVIEMEFNNGDVEKMISLPKETDVILLADRLDWYTGDRSNPVFHPRYVRGKGMQGRNRFLLLFADAIEWHFEHDTYFMYSSWGKTNGVQFSRNVIGAFFAKYHKKVEEQLAASLDNWTFKIPVTVGEPYQPNPNYPTKTTPPVLNMPGTFDEENPARYMLENGLMVPPEIRRRIAEQFWPRVAEWLAAPADPRDTYESEFGGYAGGVGGVEDEKLPEDVGAGADAFVD